MLPFGPRADIILRMRYIEAFEAVGFDTADGGALLAMTHDNRMVVGGAGDWVHVGALRRKPVSGWDKQRYETTMVEQALLVAQTYERDGYELVRVRADRQDSIESFARRVHTGDKVVGLLLYADMPLRHGEVGYVRSHVNTGGSNAVVVVPAVPDQNAMRAFVTVSLVYHPRDGWTLYGPVPTTYGTIPGSLPLVSTLWDGAVA